MTTTSDRGVTPAAARDMLEATVREIAPDARLEGLRADADLRDAFELDSLDWVEIIERLSARAGFHIDDEDADLLRRLDSATAFLAAHAVPSG